MCYNTNECIKQFSVCFNTCLNIAIVKNILSELLTVDYQSIYVDSETRCILTRNLTKKNNTYKYTDMSFSCVHEFVLLLYSKNEKERQYPLSFRVTDVFLPIFKLTSPKETYHNLNLNTR